MTAIAPKIELSTERDFELLKSQGWKIQSEQQLMTDEAQYRQLTLTRDPTKCDAAYYGAINTATYALAAPPTFAISFSLTAALVATSFVFYCAASTTYDSVVSGNNRFGTTMNLDGSTRLIDNRPGAEAVGREGWESGQQQMTSIGESLLDVAERVWSVNQGLFDGLRPGSCELDDQAKERLRQTRVIYIQDASV